MDRQNLVPILITILIAAGLTYLILFWNDSSKSNETTKAKQPTFTNELRILVAAENLSIGRKLQKKDLIWQEWPKETLSKNYTVEKTRKLDHFVGMLIRAPVTKGEPILEKHIIQPANRNVLAAIIKPGMRGMSIEVNEVTGVGGFIFPGDYVDVITIISGNNETSIKAETLVKNVLVIAIDQTTSRDASSIAKIVKTVTVEVSPKHVETITKAINQGQIILSLQGLLE